MEKHPAKGQVQVVIDTLTKVLPRAVELEKTEKCSVKMMESEVYPACGTPMCHGGWYAVSKGLSRYYLGAREIARDLGFGNEDRLIDWAAQSPEIWGNEYGDGMFCDGSAFTCEMGNDSLSLSTIIDHWKGVQSRLPE